MHLKTEIKSQIYSSNKKICNLLYFIYDFLINIVKHCTHAQHTQTSRSSTGQMWELGKGWHERQRWTNHNGQAHLSAFESQSSCKHFGNLPGPMLKPNPLSLAVQKPLSTVLWNCWPVHTLSVLKPFWLSPFSGSRAINRK